MAELPVYYSDKRKPGDRLPWAHVPLRSGDTTDSSKYILDANENIIWKYNGDGEPTTTEHGAPTEGEWDRVAKFVYAGPMNLEEIVAPAAAGYEEMGGGARRHRRRRTHRRRRSHRRRTSRR